jgi:hypothetical protein
LNQFFGMQIGHHGGHDAAQQGLVLESEVTQQLPHNIMQ